MPEFIQNNLFLSILIAYVAIISIIPIIVCFYDKKISKLNRVGYFCKDSKNENTFNRVVGLKDSFPKK